MNINGLDPLSQISSFFEISRPADQPPQQQAGGSSRYGDAFAIEISPEALALSQSSGSQQSGLSADAAKKLEKLFEKMDKIFEKADGKPLTEQQQNQLEKLEGKLAKLFEENDSASQFKGLEKADKKELDGLYKEMSKILDGIGDKPVSDADSKKLQGIEKKIDEILSKNETKAPSFFELSEKASSELDDLFAKLDEMFKKNANGSFNKDQQTQLRVLDNKLIEMLSGVS